MLAKIFSHKIFDSKIHSYDTEGKESFLGYFFGPMLLYMAYDAIAGSYLTQYYTDVLGLSGILHTECNKSYIAQKVTRNNVFLVSAENRILVKSGQTRE